MDQSVLYWVVLVLACSPLYLGLGRVMFDDWGGFGEAVMYAIKPDLLSWFRGELYEDWWSEFKLHIFLAGSGGVTYGVHMAAQHFFFARDQETQVTLIGALTRGLGPA